MQMRRVGILILTENIQAHITLFFPHIFFLLVNTSLGMKTFSDVWGLELVANRYM